MSLCLTWDQGILECEGGAGVGSVTLVVFFVWVSEQRCSGGFNGRGGHVDAVGEGVMMMRGEEDGMLRGMR